jgi:uncharacterized membrane protein
MTDAFPSGRRAASASAAGAPEIRKVAFDAPWAWLAAGWRDLWTAPQISLTYGAAFSLAAYAFVFELARYNALSLLLPLAGGFLLLGPLLAVGLYEVSRRIESGEAISYPDIFFAGWAASGQVALFGMLLLILYFFWVRLASLLFMLFFGLADFPPIDNFIPTLLFTSHGLGLLVTGTAAGGLLAICAYAISAISVPMLFDRKVDAVTAIIASVRAVRENSPAMTLWAVLICGLTVVGIAALFVGLAVTFPLIGHATWHAYKALTR